MQNKERLNILRQDVMRTFSACACDVQAAMTGPDITISGKEKAPGSPFRYRSPIKVRQHASSIADRYSYAYFLSRSLEEHSLDGMTIADNLIAIWGEAQMLTILPEMIDEPNADIQHDIADLFDKVDKKLAYIKTYHGAVHDKADNARHSNVTDETAKLRCLKNAEETLRYVQGIVRNNYLTLQVDVY